MTRHTYRGTELPLDRADDWRDDEVATATVEVEEWNYPTLPEVLEYTGLTYRQLDHWVRKGYISPEVEAQGSGSQRGWASEELEVAKTARILVDRGYLPHRAIELVRSGSGRTTVRLINAGLEPATAERVARDITWSGYPTTRIAPGITITVTGDAP